MQASVVYRVAVSVHADRHPEWLAWMAEQHIPEVLKTHCFESCRMVRILEPAAESGSVAYDLEYVCRSLDDLQTYRERYGSGLQKEHSLRFQGAFTASRTVAQVLQTWTGSSQSGP